MPFSVRSRSIPARLSTMAACYRPAAELGGRIIMILLGSVLALLLSSGCLFAAPVMATPELRLSPQEEAWLQAHPQIRIAINNAWAPMDFVDAMGAPQGIGVDFIRALNQRLGGRLKIVAGPWKQIYSQVQQKQLDALMDITPRAERRPFFHFTSPYAEIPHLIVGRKTAPYYRSLADLQGKTLAVEEGLFVGMSGGASVEAAVQVAKDLSSADTVVTLLPDRGDRYLSTELFRSVCAECPP